MNFKTKRLIVTALPFFIVLIIFAVKPLLLEMSAMFPECRFLSRTGFLCPACGNTRAVQSMLSLNFIDAIRYNATIPFLCILILLIYAEKMIDLWIQPKKEIHLFPHKLWFYVMILTLWIVYLIIRNIFNFMP